MAPSEHPQTPPEPSETPATTGIQTPPDRPVTPESPSIPLSPLPPSPPVMDLAKFLRLRRGFDAALVAVVLLFAFLIASFPVTNPDFFRQLAIGRLVLQGGYPFGADPFVYSTDNEDYHVNHSWLFAVLMYGVYQLPGIGGVAVVVVKALLMVGLAEILLRTGRRRGQSLWLPAACTALALLALSPRLYLQSSLLSYLFLGATLWLLTAGREGSKRLWWLLPPLFILWVNCDQWFFLGPLTVALYLAGEGIQLWQSVGEGEPAAADRQKELRSLGLMLAAGLAACLINPHHVHAFTLPPELGLSAANDVIEQDPQFRGLFASPLQRSYYESRLGVSIAALAYWPLLLASLASFVFVFGRVPWWRLVVWMAFGLLSLYNVRCIPFFAVVAGPIMARNWLDYAAHRFGPEPLGWRDFGRGVERTVGLLTGMVGLFVVLVIRNWSLGGRVLTLLAGLALLIAAVPGWLQTQPQYRRLGWSVRVDPSLKTMADTIRDWRAANRLKGEPHWFNTNHEVSSYLAWFAPGERTFLDQGLPHFRKAAEDYLTIRQGLEQEVPNFAGDRSNATAPKVDWRKQLRKRGVRYWIFDNNNLSGNKADMGARWVLFSKPQEWVLCHLQGRIAIFAWRDPQRQDEDPSQGLAINLDQAAFGPQTEQAPPRGPEPPSARSWWQTCWDAWWQPLPPASLDRETLPFYDMVFQTQEEPRRVRQIYEHSRAWQGGNAAGAIAASLTNGPMPRGLLALSWSCTYHDLFPPGALQPARRPRQSEQAALFAQAASISSQTFDPPASLYLSIRAARRAVHDDPESAVTYLRLGQAYQRLTAQPQERNFRDTAPRLLAIRRTQMAVAFQNCLRYQPEPFTAAQAHEALADIYKQLNYLDATSHHLHEALDQLRAAGPLAPGLATQHNQRLEQMTAEAGRLDAELERRRNTYDVRTVAKEGLEKAKIALDLGLPETALVAVEEASDTRVTTGRDWAVVKEVTSATLDLGRLDKARELLLPVSESTADQPLAPEEVDLHLRLAAAHGDYAEADRLLSGALTHVGKPLPSQAIPPLYLLVADSVGRVLLAGTLPLTHVPLVPTPDPRLPTDFWVRRWRMDATANAVNLLQQDAEWRLTRGWLALEAGHCVEARRDFEAVRDRTVLPENWLPELNRVSAWLRQVEIYQVQQLRDRHVALHELSRRYLLWLDKR